MARRESIFTSNPTPPAPALVCGRCGGHLVYRQTVYGGVNHPERWDYYDCRICGPFKYRHRTRRLEPTTSITPWLRSAMVL